MNVWDRYISLKMTVLKLLEYYEKSLNIYLMIYGENASWGIANVSIGMGRVYSNQGDYSKALVCFEESLKIFFVA